jgi:hypothetical protein
MNRYDISSLVSRAKANDIGESLELLVSLPCCRISLVAREGATGCFLTLEAVARYDIPLSPIESASRRRLVRRIESLGFQLVQENGSKVYELRVSETDIERVMASLLRG